MAEQGERVRLPAHHAVQAAHHTPHPLIRKSHPAAGHTTRAHAHTARRPALHHGSGTHIRATIVTAANPATVQIHGSDQVALWPLAQHVAVGTLAAGGVVTGIVFDPADPSDALLTGVY